MRFNEQRTTPALASRVFPVEINWRQKSDNWALAAPRREERECEVTASTRAEFEIGSNLDGGRSENVRSVSVDEGSGSSWFFPEFEGRSAPRLLHYSELKTMPSEVPPVSEAVPQSARRLAMQLTLF